MKPITDWFTRNWGGLLASCIIAVFFYALTSWLRNTVLVEMKNYLPMQTWTQWAQERGDRRGWDEHAERPGDRREVRRHHYNELWIVLRHAVLAAGHGEREHETGLPAPDAGQRRHGIQDAGYTELTSCSTQTTSS